MTTVVVVEDEDEVEVDDKVEVEVVVGTIDVVIELWVVEDERDVEVLSEELVPAKSRGLNVR